MTPNKLNTEATPQSHTLKALKQLIPACFTEVKNEQGELQQVVDWDTLKQLLGENIADENHERYQFTWAGKQAARLEANKATSQTLRPVPEESVDWDTTENLYIEGDNLQVLKLLQQGYMGKVKMIYIDPPYNTGNDYLYYDDFARSQAEEDLDSGDIDEDGNRYRKNPRTNGRFHSDWCSKIYSRLLIARSLLTEDGVIFISIDDNEIHNLIKICNEIFGEDNYLNTISVKSKSSSGASGGGEDRKLKKNIEYVLVYVKSSNFTRFNDTYCIQSLEDYIMERKKIGKTFAYTNVITNKGEEEFIKTIKDGKGEDIELYQVKNYEIKTVSQLSKELGISQIEVYEKYIDSIFTLENAQTSIRSRVDEATKGEYSYIIAKYKPISGRNKDKITSVGFMGSTKRLVSYLRVLCDVEEGKVYKKDKIGTLWDDLSWSSLHLESHIPYPNAQKPLSLLERLLTMQTDKESIILDFYAGSSTTGHAVFKHNLEHGAKNKFIIVQIQEDIKLQNYSNPKTKEQAEKAINFLNQINKPHNVCELGKERLRICGKKIKAENPTAQHLDIGFRVLRLADSNFNEVNRHPNEYNQGQLDLFATNIKEDRNDLDLLFGAMLSWGVPLSLSISTEEIDGCRIYNVNDGDLVACFAENVSEAVVKAMASKVSLRVLFRDSCFSEDKHKINIFEIFKQQLGWDEKEAMDKIRVI